MARIGVFAPVRRTDGSRESECIEFIINIYERKRVEQRFQRVLVTDALGVVSFDHNGTVLPLNDIFLKITGYTREQIDLCDLTWRDAAGVGAISEAKMERLFQRERIGPMKRSITCRRITSSKALMRSIAVELTGFCAFIKAYIELDT